jgi:K+-transporting ATPase c subunit
MDNLAWDCIGKLLVAIVLYCILMIICAMVFLPSTIIITAVAIYFIAKS